MDKEDLTGLAVQLGGRVTMQCGRCKNWLTLSLENRGLRYGSSPDLSALDPKQKGKPRLQFYCTYCHCIIGFITADIGEEPEGTRWEHLEI